MFKKLLFFAVLVTGFETNTMTTNENHVTEDATIITARNKKESYATLRWIAHLGTAWLCYSGARAGHNFIVNKYLSDAWGMSAREQSATSCMRFLCGLTSFYIAHSLTNEIHETISDKPYPGAHLLGALLACVPS